jgi:hypothetical protein
VFDAIPEKAHNLCEVAYGGLAVYDGEHFRMVATRGYPGHVSEAVRRPFRGNIHHQELVPASAFIGQLSARIFSAARARKADRFLARASMRRSDFTRGISRPYVSGMTAG